jgi:2-haloacid dehalogenase
MPANIRHIVFDIGKVLIHYDPELPFSRIIPDAEERKWFFDNVCTQDWNVEQDRGRSWKEAEDLLIAKYPEQESNIRAFRQHWTEMVPYSYQHSVDHLERFIAEGRDVTLLTNFADDTFDEACRIFPYLTRPRGVTVSARVRLIKPDPAIYETHVKTFDLDPQTTFFIDDSLPNVRAARACGWNAVQYMGPEKLDEDLRSFDLLS